MQPTTRSTPGNSVIPMDFVAEIRTFIRASPKPPGVVCRGEASVENSGWFTDSICREAWIYSETDSITAVHLLS